MSAASAGAGIAPGFADPSADSAHVFRAVLEAMSRPGKVVRVPGDLTPPAPLSPACAAVVLTLIDFDTPLWLSPEFGSDEVLAFLRFHTGAPMVDDPGRAAFAICAGREAAPVTDLPRGTPSYPDRSATLIVQVDELGDDTGIGLTGPGIAMESRLTAKPLPDSFWSARATANGDFPLGVDVILASPSHVAAIPRTTEADEGRG